MDKGFVNGSKNWTEEEKIMIRFHNNRVYINEFLKDCDYIFHNGGREKNPTLTVFNEILRKQFESAAIMLIESRPELKDYYSLITKF